MRSRPGGRNSAVTGERGYWPWRLKKSCPSPSLGCSWANRRPVAYLEATRKWSSVSPRPAPPSPHLEVSGAPPLRTPVAIAIRISRADPSSYPNRWGAPGIPRARLEPGTLGKDAETTGASDEYCNFRRPSVARRFELDKLLRKLAMRLAG